MIENTGQALPIKEKEEYLRTVVTQIDLEKAQSIQQLVKAYQGMSIQARAIGSVAAIFEKMLCDPERPTIILGLAGPLIAAGLRKVIRDMVWYGLVDCVVSTGAILYQDLYQASGFQHYRGDSDADDQALRSLLIDRIYDTYVDEEKFISLDREISLFADKLPVGEYSSRSFLLELAQKISDSNSILFACLAKGVPVFSPALNDSSIGIGLTDHYYRAKKESRPAISINSIRDNYELTQIVVKSKSTAAVYVAGGVPKNFINDSIVSAYIFGQNTGGHKYAVQMTADPAHWGGLSGSTLKEATSWGKISAEASTASSLVEPSVSLPLVIGFLLQGKVYHGRSRCKFLWNGDTLESLEHVSNLNSQKV